MAKQCESQFTREIRKALECVLGEEIWVRKIVANGMMQTGIPDLLLSVKGLFTGIEDKALQRTKVMTPARQPFATRGMFTPNQVINLRAIHRTGGVGLGLLYIKDEKIALIIPVTELESARHWSIAEMLGYACDHPELVIKRVNGRDSSWEVKGLISWILKHCQGNGAL